MGGQGQAEMGRDVWTRTGRDRQGWYSALCREIYVTTWISLNNMEFSDLRICAVHTVR